MLEDSLGLHKISEKFSRNGFFLKFRVRISTEFGTKCDRFQVKRMSIHPGKKSNSFTHKRTFLSARAVMNKKFISSCRTSLGLKFQPKLNRHNDECLEKISDQYNHGVMRSKSQTENEQNRFSENKTSWFFFPYLLSVICLWTYLLTWVRTTYESTCVNFFSAIRTRKKIAERRAEFHKFW